MSTNAPSAASGSDVNGDMAISTPVDSGARCQGIISARSLPTLDYNPMPHTLPEGENATPLEVIGSTASDKLVICMVGLPATGKTHIAKRICRFLSFFHDIPSQIFNVGEYRRQLCGAELKSDFYNHDNPHGMSARKLACDAALRDLMEYMNTKSSTIDDGRVPDSAGGGGGGCTGSGVRVAALDATNSTRERRQYIYETVKRKGGIKLMFVESICDQEEVSDYPTFVIVVCCLCGRALPFRG